MRSFRSIRKRERTQRSSRFTLPLHFSRTHSPFICGVRFSILHTRPQGPSFHSFLFTMFSEAAYFGSNLKNTFSLCRLFEKRTSHSLEWMCRCLTCCMTSKGGIPNVRATSVYDAWPKDDFRRL